jgi:hypothetical protein
MAPIEINWRRYKKSPPEAIVSGAKVKNTAQSRVSCEQVREFFWQVGVFFVQSRVSSVQVREFFWQVGVFFVQSRVSSVQSQEFFLQVRVSSVQARVF